MVVSNAETLLSLVTGETTTGADSETVSAMGNSVLEGRNNSYAVGCNVPLARAKTLVVTVIGVTWTVCTYGGAGQLSRVGVTRLLTRTGTNCHTVSFSPFRILLPARKRKRDSACGWKVRERAVFTFGLTTATRERTTE